MRSIEYKHTISAQCILIKTEVRLEVEQQGYEHFLNTIIH